MANAAQQKESTGGPRLLGLQGQPERLWEGEQEQIQRNRRDVSLCFLLNRRTETMRVIDFRAGAQAQKLELVVQTAQEEGISRAYTIVEREEASTWAKMGFAKEGSIPGFYKRSDGHVLGLDIEDVSPKQSTTRIRVGGSEADHWERSYQTARRLVRSRAPTELPQAKVTRARPQDVHKAFASAVRTERALTSFEPFGRDAERAWWLCTARGGFSLLVGAELQHCFDNVMVELLAAPRGDKETWLSAAGLRQICDELEAAGMVTAFSLAPADSVELSAVFLAAGFKRTGRMPDHLVTPDGRTDATIWARKLAEPR